MEYPKQLVSGLKFSLQLKPFCTNWYHGVKIFTVEADNLDTILTPGKETPNLKTYKNSKQTLQKLVPGSDTPSKNIFFPKNIIFLSLGYSSKTDFLIVLAPSEY